MHDKYSTCKHEHATCTCQIVTAQIADAGQLQDNEARLTNLLRDTHTPPVRSIDAFFIKRRMRGGLRFLNHLTGVTNDNVVFGSSCLRDLLLSLGASKSPPQGEPERVAM